MYIEGKMQSVIDSIAWSARSKCHCQECRFCDIFIKLSSKLCQKYVDIWELGDIIGWYKRNSSIKIYWRKIQEFENMTI